MILEHFLALVPLMALLVFSIIWWGKGLVHLITIAYSAILAFIAIQGQWEMLFFPICLGSCVIGLILFIISMGKGDWL